MATLVGANNFGNAIDPAVDMTAWDLSALQNGEKIVGSDGDTSCTIRAGDQTWVLTGYDFSYFITDSVGSSPVLAGGTITGIEFYSRPSTALAFYDYAISDFRLDVGDFNALVDANNVARYERALFGHDDHMQGGTGDDTLLGLRGNDHIDGGHGNDQLHGGRGNDVLIGGFGGDWLYGEQGTDIFVYRSATESSGGINDIIVGFNTHDDLLVVPHAVEGIDARVNAGYAQSGNIDPELAAALDADHLGAYHAAIVDIAIPLGPMLPAFRNATMLVVDVNGVAGYQVGEDLAIELSWPVRLNHLSVDDFVSPQG